MNEHSVRYEHHLVTWSIRWSIHWSVGPFIGMNAVLNAVCGVPADQPVHDAAAHQGLQEHEGRVHDGVRENKRQHAVRAVSQGTHTSHHHANKRILTTRHPVIDGPHSIIKFTGGLVVCFIWYFVSKGPANRSIGLEQALLTQK